MTSNVILPPFPVFLNKDGSPLNDGYIYIGEPNLNPQTNPKVAYWDEALTIPAGQPIRTSGGYAMNAGTPGALFSDGPVSVLLLDKEAVFIYNSPEVFDFNASTQASITQLQSQIITPTGLDPIGGLKDYATLRAYSGAATVSDVGIDKDNVPSPIFGRFMVDPADTTSVDDGFKTIIDGAGKRWKRFFTGPVMASWFDIKGGGTVDDAPKIQSALNFLKAFPGSVLVLDNPNGYKINTQIVQPYNVKIVGSNNLIRCEGIPVSVSDQKAAWVVEYASWVGPHDRFYMREPLNGVILRGHSAAAQGTWTQYLSGIEYRSYHTLMRNVCCVGFDKAYTLAPSATAGSWLVWEVKHEQCSAFFCGHAIYYEAAAAAGASGAGMTFTGGVFAQNDYTVYNSCTELTFIDVASDLPTNAHVNNNLTMVAGNNIGFMRWQNSRIEAGGVSGTAWINNNGVMSFDDCYFTERNGANLPVFFNGAGAITAVTGGLWRTSDGRYKAIGTGVLTQAGVAPINANNGVLLNSLNSNVLNCDFIDGTPSGFATISGDAVLSIIADPTFLFSGNCLRVTNTTLSVVESVSFDVSGMRRNIALTLKAKNTSASAITLTLKMYTRTGTLVSQPAINIPAGIAVATPFILNTLRFPGVVYCVISISVPAAISAAPLLSDFYVTSF